MHQHPSTTQTGVISQVRYLGSSAEGNPRFQVTLTDGRTWPTIKNGSVGHYITNFGEDATDHGVTVTLHLTPKGEITRCDGHTQNPL